MRRGYCVAMKSLRSDQKLGVVWLIRCDCGRTRESCVSAFKKSKAISCGCKTSEQRSAQSRTHGMSNHAAYRVWANMMGRCTRQTHPAWKDYGGRGITICRKWYAFENFWADMARGYATGLTLERRHNDREYAKTNCYWATVKEQSNNRRSNRRVRTKFGCNSASETARRAGISPAVLLYRLKQGWKGARLISPVRYGRSWY